MINVCNKKLKLVALLTTDLRKKIFSKRYLVLTCQACDVLLHLEWPQACLKKSRNIDFTILCCAIDLGCINGKTPQ